MTEKLEKEKNDLFSRHGQLPSGTSFSGALTKDLEELKVRQDAELDAFYKTHKTQKPPDPPALVAEVEEKI